LTISRLHRLLQAGNAEDAGKSGSFNAISALVSSASYPGSVLLSFYSVAYSATVASALVQVAAAKHAAAFNAAFGELKAAHVHILSSLDNLSTHPLHPASCAAGNGAQALQVVKHVTQLVQDASEVVVIVGLTWTAINLKDHALAYLQHALVRGDANSGLARILRPASSLLTYGIMAAGALASLAAFGINLNPLLASLGASSVVIGLATQRILGNVASALTLVSRTMRWPTAPSSQNRATRARIASPLQLKWKPRCPQPPPPTSTRPPLACSTPPQCLWRATT
jgi:small-conductance mechanosensitive channel